MAVSDDAEKSPPSAPALSRWIDRVGAALVAPRLAMADSDQPSARGRASSDIALLFFVALLASQTDLFVSAGWLLYDGEWAGALTVLVGGAQKYLMVGVLLLLAATIVLSLLAGRRRSIADDFDLVCVTLTPLVVVEIVNALFFLVGIDIHPVGRVVGYGWFALLWVISYRRTQMRELAA